METKNSIKDINDFLKVLNKSISNNNDCINYNFEIKDNKIDVKIIDESLIFLCLKKFKSTYSYYITILNKDIQRLIKNTLKNIIKFSHYLYLKQYSLFYILF